MRGIIGILSMIMVGACSSAVFEGEHRNPAYPTGAAKSGQAANLQDGIMYGLPKVVFPFEVERSFDEKTRKPIFKVTAQTPIKFADPEHLYLLRYNYASTSTSTVKITVNANGLLSAVSSDTKDALPSAVTSVADFLVGLGATKLPATPKLQASPPPGKRSAFKITGILDPTLSADELKDDPFVAQLRFYGVEVYIDSPGYNAAQATSAQVREQCSIMVCYRMVLPYNVTFTDSATFDDAYYASAYTATVLAPNEGPIAGINIQRRALVQNVFTLKFNDGILGEAEYKDPSTVAAMVSIPIDLAKSVVSIPSALFQFKVASDTSKAEFEAQKSIVDAQKQLLESQIQLLEKQNALAKAAEDN